MYKVGYFDVTGRHYTDDMSHCLSPFLQDSPLEVQNGLAWILAGARVHKCMSLPVGGLNPPLRELIQRVRRTSEEICEMFDISSLFSLFRIMLSRAFAWEFKVPLSGQSSVVVSCGYQGSEDEMLTHWGTAEMLIHSLYKTSGTK